MGPSSKLTEALTDSADKDPTRATVPCVTVTSPNSDDEIKRKYNEDAQSTEMSSCSDTPPVDKLKKRRKSTSPIPATFTFNRAVEDALGTLRSDIFQLKQMIDVSSMSI
jgi:hypothetical protein